MAAPYIHRCPIKLGCICDPASQTSAPKWDWSFVDTVFCICLQDRDDRLQHSAEQFHRYGLCTKVLYYRPTKPTDDDLKKHKVKARAKFGSWESHRFVAWYARTQLNSQRNLVFEDDLQFKPWVELKHLRKVTQHLNRLPDDWEIYYLGHMPLYGNTPQGDSLWKVKSAMIHAYITSEKCMDRLIASPFLTAGKKGDDETQLDLWLMPRANQYTISPMLVTQADLSSDAGGGSWYEWGIKLHDRQTRLVEFIFLELFYVLVIIAVVVIIFVAVYVLVKCRPEPIAGLGI